MVKMSLYACMYVCMPAMFRLILINGNLYTKYTLYICFCVLVVWFGLERYSLLFLHEG